MSSLLAKYDTFRIKIGRAVQSTLLSCERQVSGAQRDVSSVKRKQRNMKTVFPDNLFLKIEPSLGAANVFMYEKKRPTFGVEALLWGY